MHTQPPTPSLRYLTVSNKNVDTPLMMLSNGTPDMILITIPPHLLFMWQWFAHVQVCGHLKKTSALKIDYTASWFGNIS